MGHLEDQLDLVCKKCKVHLMRFPGPDGGPDAIVHTRPWVEYDHEPVPAPASAVPDRLMVCDFCGEHGARWQYEGETTSAYGQREDGQPFEALQQIDGTWAACDACDVFARRGDVDGLVRRYAEAVVPQRVNAYMAELGGRAYHGDPGHQRQLWAAYLPTIRNRSLMPPRKTLTELKPQLMPKIRDRAAAFWLTDRAKGGIRTDAEHAAYIALPGYLFDSDRFVRPTRGDELATDFGDEVLTRHCARVARDLTTGELYWISPQFTHLAVTAAKALPDVTVVREELPSASGMVIWQTPIHEVTLDAGFTVPIRCAAWSLIPQGVWITVYIQPEHAMSRLEPEVLREQIGFVMPWTSGGGAAFGTHNVDAEGDNMLIRVLVSTWLLMRQPGVAEQSKEKPYKETIRKYRRAGRPEPTVSVVNIRRTVRAARPASDSGRNYTGSWAVGLRTGGFWRTYWTGTGRSVRDRRWIDPYIARGDLPMKSDSAPKPTVKVLK